MSVPLKLGFTMARRGDKLTSLSPNVMSKSAQVAEAERTINHLEEENSRLLQELNDVRSLYKQLTTECTRESFDEHRVNLLKSQVIQLERQNALLTETINNRSEILMEAENALAATIDYCHLVMAQKGRISEVTVSCTEFSRIVSTLESARKHLCRMAEKTSSLQDCSKPLLWYGGFLRNRPDQPVTLFDICRGDIEHINLKHVSRLESQLVDLYKELVLVSNTLQICIQSSSSDEVISDAPSVVYSRLSDQVQHSCDLLQDVCRQLLQLSLLVPAAPLPALNKPPFEGLTVDNIMKVFGKSAKTRDAKRLIEALVKYVNMSVNHAGIENQVLLEELEFHRAIYKLEKQYIESLFLSMKNCYAEFENDMQEVICQPLGEVLWVFDELTESADHQSLLHFIEVFRNHSSGLLDAVQRLSVNASNQSDKACQFSEYGSQFLKRMKHCHTECKRKRDLHIAELDAVKQQLSEQTKELIQIISEKDEHLNGKALQVHQKIQTRCKSSSEKRQSEMSEERKHRSPEAECTCHSEDTSTTIDKLDNSATFCDDLKISATADVVSCCSLLLPPTSVSSSRDRPPPNKQVKSKRMVPGIVQRSLILKPNHDNFNCNEIRDTFSRAKSTDNHERSVPNMRRRPTSLS